MNNENYNIYITLIDINGTEYATDVKLILNNALYIIALSLKIEILSQLIAIALKMNIIYKQMTKQRILQEKYRPKNYMYKTEKSVPDDAKSGAE